MDRLSTNDQNFAQKVQKWLFEDGEELPVVPTQVELSDQEDDQSFSDHDDDEIDQNYEPNSSSREDSNGEDSINDEDDSDGPDDDNNDPGETIFLGKNGFRWSSIEPKRNIRTPARNIISGLPGLKGPARGLGLSCKPVDVWRLLSTSPLIQSVVGHTNAKLESVRKNIGETTGKSNYRPTDEIEIEALLGVYLLSSIFKSSSEDMRSMFATGVQGRPVFRAFMSGKRFEILNYCLRFYDKITRPGRLKVNKAAAILDIFQNFVNNCQAVFIPSEFCTIDEMLIPFRGRCPFKIYMPKKPAKYGIKIMALTDSKCSYFFDGYIYSGKGSDGDGLSEIDRKKNVSTQAVLRLTKHISGTGRNITGDNWFTSIPLVKELKEIGLTYVGTLRANKPELPLIFRSPKNRPVGSVLYGFNEEITLLSHVPKKNKVVNIISTMHNDKGTSSGKPEMVNFYNKTKGGVDHLDYKLSKYSSNRRTPRWPMAIFYAMVDISGINSHLLHMCFTKNKQMKRADFIYNLAIALGADHLQSRLQIPNMPANIKQIIQETLASLGPIDNPERSRSRNNGNERHLATDTSQRDISDKIERRTCTSCPYSLKRKTTYCCIFYRRAI